MKRLLRAAGVALALAASTSSAEGLMGGRYAHPVDRYGHFAPGPAHEYSTLIVQTRSGREFELVLPVDEVFEDVVPRSVSTAVGKGNDALLVIVSNRVNGSRLALVGLRDDRAVLTAQSAPTGAPKRWVNPVGIGDLDGDGAIEIAAVTTPHIGGTLRIYRILGDRLVEVASLPGFSNHVFGTPQLGLSTVGTLDDAILLVVPDMERRSLRIVSFANDRLTEVGRCALDGPVVGRVTIISPSTIVAELESGSRTIAIVDCAI